MGLTGMLLAATLSWGAAQAADQLVGGVKVSASMASAGAMLQLNGAGVRFKGPFKVYTAALYTGKKVSTAEEFHAAPGPKRIVLTMHREIEAPELGRLFIKGIQSNALAAALPKILADLPRMGEIFGANKKLLPGDQLTVEWIPNSGMVISVKGVPQGEAFRAPEFFSAMMDIWLGSSPADWQLKDALLGKSSAPSPT